MNGSEALDVLLLTKVDVGLFGRLLYRLRYPGEDLFCLTQSYTLTVAQDLGAVCQSPETQVRVSVVDQLYWLLVDLLSSKCFSAFQSLLTNSYFNNFDNLSLRINHQQRA